MIFSCCWDWRHLIVKKIQWNKWRKWWLVVLTIYILFWPIFSIMLTSVFNSWLLATLTYGYRLRLWLLNPTFWKLIMFYMARVQLWSATCTVLWGVKVSIRGVYNQRVSNRILTIYLSIVVSELKFPTSYEGPRSNTLSFVTYMMWINRKDHNLNNANF